MDKRKILLKSVGKASSPVSARVKRAAKRTRDNRPFNPGSARYLRSRILEQKALDLRLEGLSYLDVGRKLGVSYTTAYNIIMRLLDRFDAELQEKIPRARQVEIERCRKLLSHISPKVKRGDVKAVQVALKISERLSRLRGLDAPIDLKHSGTGEDGAISVEIFRKMLTDAEEKKEDKEQSI
jgi:hypothetical protein